LRQQKLLTQYSITGEVDKEIALVRGAYERSKLVMEVKHYVTAMARAASASGLAFARRDPVPPI